MYADQLAEAYVSGKPIDPLSETDPGLTIDDAYAIQAAQIRDWATSGRHVRGYKVGLTSLAMQRQLGVDQPDFGYLVDGMYHQPGSVVSIGSFIAPRIEPEIAFVLGADLSGPGVTVEEARRAVSSVVGALELIDSRIVDWRISLIDTIADNASSAGVVVGHTALPLESLDIEALAVTLAKNGEHAGSGTGAAVLGSPLNALVWLANTLGTYGVTLKAGSVVIPGSVCAAVPVGAGDTITADFGPLGSVSLSFSS
ncbi:2-keto-4-pentenoate hydratase [Subtercola frigoramans]